MKKRYSKSGPLGVLTFLVACLLSFSAMAQVTISNESFPNEFNPGFSRPINSTYAGSAGTWSVFSTDANATLVCNSAFYQSSPYALKIVNYNNSASSVGSTCRATSPTINLSGVGCTQKVDVVFKLYTYALTSNSCFTFYVEYSSDNGSTWTTIWQKTAAQLLTAYGSGTWNDIYLGIPSSYFNASFKYRFRGTANGGCGVDNFLYVDDAQVLNWPCANTLSLGNRVWYDTNNDGNNSGENGIAGVTVNLYNDANNDNAADGAAIANTTTDANGFYSFGGLNAGNYIVGVVTPAGYMSSSVNGGDPDNNINLDDNGQVTVGNETRGLAITLAAGTEPDGNDNITYDFGFLPDCSCTTSGNNLLVNGNFENGTTGWNWSGGTLTTGTGFVACGAANGFNNWSSGTSKVWQDVTVAAGATVTFKGFAGTHTPGLACAPQLSLIFLNSTGGVISQSNANITRDVDVNFSQLEQYTISAVAPAGTVKVRVQSSINCNTVKMDAFCLTSNTPAPTGSIGNFVWGDANGNGVQDAGENGIDGVTVQLFLDANNDCVADGAAIASVITSGGGAYTFSGLAAGNYLLVFPTISGYFPSPANLGGDDTKDSDIDPNTGKVCGVSLSAGQNRTDVDAGYCPTTLALGDRVFFDLNNNGYREDAEGGIQGVVLNLYRDANNDNVADGAAIATTTTDVNGSYRFDGLLPGNYIVGAVIPASYASSTTNGGDPDNDIDRDDNGINVVGTEVRGLAITITGGAETLESGNYNHTYDFGFYQPLGSIGDFVWNDLNANGVQDSGEPGLQGVTITLTKPGGVTETATTDANGFYQFTGLPAGNYIVSFPPSIAGFTPTPRDLGGDDTKDSDPDASGNVTVTLGLGQNNNTIDAGYCPTTLVLGNTVWQDNNNNGVKEAGEPVLGGVAVNLYKDDNNDNIPDGAPISTTTTNAAGIYSFSNLVPGNYIVGIVIPAGFVPSAVNGGDPDNNIDNDNNGVTSAGGILRSQTVTLTGNGEPDVAVDGDGRNGNQTVDFGLYKLGSIGDFVWFDANGNGAQDAGENGVSNITVTLYNAAGAPIATTTTDGNGAYNFANLPAGTYSVGFTLPTDFVFTTKDATADDKDSDADPVTGRTGAIVLAAGQSIITVDAGIKQATAPKASVGDFVWNDLDGDGFQDPGEPGIPGVTVRLFNAATNTIVATTTTDQFGNYHFGDLNPGSYFIVVTKPVGYDFTGKDLNSNDVKDSDVGTNGITTPFALLAGENNTTIDAGLKSTSTNTGKIGNYVWIDEDKDGIQDTNENGVGGVLVTLYDGAGSAIATTTTNAVGFYQFTNLAAGTYSVGFSNLPPFYVFSPKDAGANDALDSDADQATGRTGTISLAAGQVYSDFDCGIIPPGGGSLPAALGDFVWFDANSNGIQDGTEEGAPGIIVTLYNAANVAIGTAITDGSGFYIFENLLPGTYSVGFSNIKPGYTITGANTGGDDTKDSDADPVTGRSSAVTLAGGDFNFDLDAGIRPIRASLGGLVWNDNNKNGLYEAGEPLVGGVLVTLYNSVGTPIATQITGTDGTYLFTNLDAGNYSVGFTNIPPGYFFVPAKQGTDNNIDSDAAPANGRTAAITLPPGGFDKTLFAGISNSTLAVNVVSFTATLGTNKQVSLNWTLSEETNMSGYDVERSLDGVNFTKLGTVAARGANNSVSYNYMDDVQNITSSVIYYRIKLVDRANSGKYTNVLPVKLSGKQKGGVTISPNPANSFVVVRVSAQKNDVAAIRVIDMSGKLVIVRNERVSAGVNAINIYNLDRLAAGTYNVQVVIGAEVYTEKLVVNK
jgi:SdrD B-like domain/Secretion system C-terminal sorting domain